MSRQSRARQDAQAGFTLVELIIAMALSVFVMTALFSVIFTSFNAGKIAEGRVAASSEVRTFELRANDDFTKSALPDISGYGCGDSSSNACTTSPIVLNGKQASNAVSPTISPVTVTYAWDGSALLDRTVTGGSTTALASDATGFTWYEDTATNTVVVRLTVTVNGYSETQTFWFYPRLAP